MNLWEKGVSWGKGDVGCPLRAFLSKYCFGFKESCAKMSHQLKTHVRDVTPTLLTPLFAHLLISLTKRA